MTPLTLSLARLAGLTGRGVRVAVVDSGVHGAHPHVVGVLDSAGFDDEGRAVSDTTDRLGHGTAVAGAIREKAPEAILLSAKVFDRSLATSGRALVAAIRWAADERAALINLSLGTVNQEHRPALVDAVGYAVARGALVVAAAPEDGAAWLPGGLDGVVGVTVDWSIPRDRCAWSLGGDGQLRARASGYPRPIPGVPVARNVQGPSFATANVSGFLALALESREIRTTQELMMLLGSITRSV